MANRRNFVMSSCGATALFLAGLCVLLAGCGADGSSGPLVATTLPSTYCLPSQPAWNSPIGFTSDWYVNEGTQPVVIKSVRLLAPHDLFLHGAVVYEMEHSLNPLNIADPWSQVGKGADPGLWKRRQQIPGAVIPSGHAPLTPVGFTPQRNYYVIAEDVSATSPGGGWALGEIVTYKSAGHTYTVEAHTGVAIGGKTLAQLTSDNALAAHYCDAANKALSTLFKRKPA